MLYGQEEERKLQETKAQKDIALTNQSLPEVNFTVLADYHWNSIFWTQKSGFFACEYEASLPIWKKAMAEDIRAQ